MKGAVNMRNILLAILLFTPVLLVAQQVERDTLSQEILSPDKILQPLPQKDTILVPNSDISKTLEIPQPPPQKKKIRIINSDITNLVESDTGKISYLQYNVKIEHEGSVMTCDSAVMWPNGIFESYGNTKVINGTTVITGDAMIYNEITGKANVTGRIVYLTDGSSTLRTTKVDFDTETEIGYFEHEGTIVDSFRTLESQKGYYYSKIKEFEFIGQVQSDTKDYVLQSDSMKYNTETKLFTFYLNTHIWSEDGYMYCDKGWYDSDKDIIFFHRNSYILSSKQEIFADSIYYENLNKKGRLYSNIQITDTAQKMIALADFADFDMNTENFLMRRNPSIIMYDDKDSVFMRADTLYSVTKTIKIPVPKNDSLPSKSDTVSVDLSVSVSKNDLLPSKPDTVSVDLHIPVSKNDSLPSKPDTVSVDLPISVSKNDLLPSKSDSILPKASENIVDTITYVDSTYKELFAFKDAKLYRKDFQLRGDSMYFNNLDSIWKTYYNPILWDGKKMQITSDSMKFYMKNGEIKYADFNGDAMLVVPEGNPDTTMFFNQIKSKNMRAHLNNSQLTLFEAMGNVQTIAFSMGELTMNKTDAALFKILFESGKARKIGYYEAITGNNNPLFDVREDEIKLPGYRWEIDMRPKSGNEVLNRDLRSSERQSRELLSKPSFPITKRIDEIESKIKN
jgi:lipopolysaccharide export system protein LptA